MGQEDHARYRKLYPRAWKSFRGLSLEEKAIAVYLLTGDQTNRIGLYDFSVGKAIEDLETSPQTFNKGFANVIKRLGWEYDEVNRVLFIPSWWKWNPPENPNVLIGNLKDLQEVADSPLIADFICNTEHLEFSETLLGTFHNTLEKRYPKGYPKPSPKQEQEQEQEQKQKQKKDIVGKTNPPSLSPVVLAELWNQHKPPCLPQVRFPISEKRQKKLKLSINGQGQEYWVELFQDIDLSEFYTGRDGKWTGMDFDWAVINHEKLRQKLDRLKPMEASHQSPPQPIEETPTYSPDPDCSICRGGGLTADGPCKCLGIPEEELRDALKKPTKKDW